MPVSNLWQRIQSSFARFSTGGWLLFLQTDLLRPASATCAFDTASFWLHSDGLQLLHTTGLSRKKCFKINKTTIFIATGIRSSTLQTTVLFKVILCWPRNIVVFPCTIKTVKIGENYLRNIFNPFSASDGLYGSFVNFINFLCNEGKVNERVMHISPLNNLY